MQNQMTQIHRRQFAGTVAVALGAAMLSQPANTADEPSGLPAVRWGKHRIARLLVGPRCQVSIATIGV